MKFLETITWLGNDVLVPIDRIKYINKTASENGIEIIIKSDDGEWIECFGKDSVKAHKRYKMIQKIVKSNIEKQEDVI